MNDHITPELCRKLLRYDHETGKFYWLPRIDDPKWTGKWSGKEAITALSRGYKKGSIYNVAVKGHRLAWMIYYGEIPSDDVDHINGDRTDNRISNLRIVDRSTNMRNASIPKDNTSGVIGVSWSKDRQKWCAYIKHDGKIKPLGRYAKKEDAIYARKSAEEKYGYHANHGRSGPLALNKPI